LRSSDGKKNYRLFIFYKKIPGGARRLDEPGLLAHGTLPEASSTAESMQHLGAENLSEVETRSTDDGLVAEELNAAQRPERTRFDRARQELRITLNIARRNSPEDENDTWVLVSDQYLDVMDQGTRPEFPE
jgi:predicted short-subunit dehydrogenase-like oxidoreductase (DUF2520 family)